MQKNELRAKIELEETDKLIGFPNFQRKNEYSSEVDLDHYEWGRIVFSNLILIFDIDMQRFDPDIQGL